MRLLGYNFVQNRKEIFMAYATSNPVRKISQMGDSNSLWYYTDGDAIGTIDDADYFLADYGQLTAGDIIFINISH